MRVKNAKRELAGLMAAIMLANLLSSPALAVADALSDPPDSTGSYVNAELQTGEGQDVSGPGETETESEPPSEESEAPEESTQPEGPTESAGVAPGESPEESADPESTDEPETSSSPDVEQTEAPSEPAESSTPSEAPVEEPPEQSAAPEQSEAPAQSEEPTQSQEPVQSEGLVQTEVPAESATPEVSEAPATSPQQSAAPAESVLPAESIQPVEPTASVQPVPIDEGLVEVMSLDGIAYSVRDTATESDAQLVDVMRGYPEATTRLYDKANKLVGSDGAQSYDKSGVQAGDELLLAMDFGYLKDPGTEGGIQEGVSYSMPLPAELVPNDTDSDGLTVLNPTVPIELFRSGDVRAFGGIYTTGNWRQPYELRVSFVDVDGAIEVELRFQYLAKVKTGLTPAKEYSWSVSSETGNGSVQLYFRTAVEKQDTWECHVEGGFHKLPNGEWCTDCNPQHRYNGNTDGSTMHWTFVAEWNGDGPAQTDATICLHASDGHAFCFDNGYFTSVNNSSAPYFTVYATYGDGHRVNLNAYYAGRMCFYDPDMQSGIQGYNGNQCVQIFGSTTDSGRTYLTSDNLVYGATKSGVARTWGLDMLEIRFGLVNYYNGSSVQPVPNIVKWEVEFSTEPLDDGWDVNSGKHDYSISPSVFPKGDTYWTSGSSNNARLKYDYGGFGPKSGTGIVDSYTPEFGNIAKQLHFTGGFSGGNYDGKIIRLDWMPNYVNTIDAYYYPCLFSAYFREEPVGGNTGLFESLTVDSRSFTWARASWLPTGGATDSDPWYLENLDGKAAYQLKKMLGSDYAQSNVWYSTETNFDGNHMFLVFDKEIASFARSASSQWGYYDSTSALPETNGQLLKKVPADWHIYFVNMDGADVSWRVLERFGNAVFGETRKDSPQTGAVVDRYSVGNGRTTSSTAVTASVGPRYVNILSSEAAWTSIYTGPYEPFDSVAEVTLRIDTNKLKIDDGNRVTQLFLKIENGAHYFDYTVNGDSLHNNFSDDIGITTLPSGVYDAYTGVRYQQVACYKLNSKNSWTPFNNTVRLYPNEAGFNSSQSYSYNTLLAACPFNATSNDLVIGLSSGDLWRCDRDSYGFITIKIPVVCKQPMNTSQPFKCESAVVIYNGDLSGNSWGDMAYSGSGYGTTMNVATLLDTCWLQCGCWTTSSRVDITGQQSADDIYTPNIIYTASCDGLGRFYTYHAKEEQNILRRYNGALGYCAMSATSQYAPYMTLEACTVNFLDSSNHTIKTVNFSPDMIATAAGWNPAHRVTNNGVELHWWGSFDSSSAKDGKYRPFSIRIPDLNKISDTQVIDEVRVEYTVRFDAARYMAEHGQPDYVDADFSLRYWSNSYMLQYDSPSTSYTDYISASMHVIAALDVAQSASGERFSSVTTLPQLLAMNAATVGSYTDTAKIGISPVSYLAMDGHITGYADSVSGAERTEAESVGALRSAMSLRNAKIEVKTPNDSTFVTVYSNGAFTDEYSASTLTTAGLHDGQIYRLELRKADGSNIHAGSQVRFTYDMVLDMDHEVEPGVTFRDSDYYDGGMLTIKTCVVATRPYDTAAALPDMAALADSTEPGTFSTDADGSANYLRPGQLLKLVTDHNADYSHTEFLIAYRGRTFGKDRPEFSIEDAVYQVSEEELLPKLIAKGINEADAKAALAKMNKIFIDTMSVSDLDFRYDGTATTLDTEPVYSQPEEVADARVSFGEDGVLSIVRPRIWDGGPIFTATAAPVDFFSVSLLTYDIDIDWDAYFAALEKAGLVKGGKILGVLDEVKAGFSNDCTSGEGESASWDSSHVEISRMYMDKSVLADEPLTGETMWSLRFGTGMSTIGDLTVTDELHIVTDERMDLSNCLTMSGFTLTQDTTGGPLTIYADGGITDEAKAAGWTDDSVTFEANDRGLSLTIAEAMLEQNQSYELSYLTVMDWDAFIAEANRVGVEPDEAGYSLNNGAVAMRADWMCEDSATVSHDRDHPVSVQKTGTISEEDPFVSEWTVTANTGDMARRDVRISDTLSGSRYLSKACGLDAMRITVTDSDGEHVVLDMDMDKPESEYVDDMATWGASLDVDTNSYLTWTVGFDSLPADVDIHIQYRVKVDADRYEAAGGDFPATVSISNTARMTCADGSTADATEKLTPEFSKIFRKSGRVVGTTADGSSRMEWTLWADLLAKYTTDELQGKTVTLTDKLPSGLTYMDGSVLLHSRTDRSKYAYESLSPTEYDVSTAKGADGREVLTIVIHNPEEHPFMRLTFQTAVQTTLDSVSNVASLTVGDEEFDAGFESGSIKSHKYGGFVASMKQPKLQLTARKFLDGELVTEPGKFNFSLYLAEVDWPVMPLVELAEGLTSNPDGEPVRVASGTTGPDGIVTFDDVDLNVPTYAGYCGYVFLAQEDDGNGEFSYDKTTYRIDVSVERGKTEYLVTYSVTDMEGNPVSGITFHNSTLINVPVSKAWDDGANRDGKRPETVMVRLLANGAETDRVTLSEETGWEHTFTGLRRTDSNGDLIQYTITEDPVKDYSSEVTGDAESGFIVKNSYTPGKTSLGVIKVWKDQDDQDGKRPDSVTVNLIADGKATDKALTLTAKDGWTGTFTDLDEYVDGHVIAYTVEEVKVPDYTSSIDYTGATAVITNSHVTEQTSISVQKVWEDSENQDDKRPAQITISLLKDGTVINSNVLSEENGWTYTFEGLAKYEAGKKINYTVTEVAVEGYTSQVTGTMEDGFVITNTIVPSTIPDKPVTPPDKPSTPPSPPSDSGNDNDDDPEPKKAIVELAAEKTLDGKVPQDNVFTFILRDEKGNVIDTVKNDGKKVSFPALSFDRSGEYTYTISEQVGKDEDIIYDDTVYTVTISVEKRHGDYVAEVVYEKDGTTYDGTPLFENITVTEAPIVPTAPVPGAPEPELTPAPAPTTEPAPVVTPDIPDDSNVNEKPLAPDHDKAPKTGDISHTEMWLALAALSTVGILSAMFLSKKKDDAEKDK